MKYDAWQERVLQTRGNIAICSPRQMGKSTVISEDAGNYALKNSKKSIMIIASTDRQSLLLFEKVLAYIYATNKHKIVEKGSKKPTKHELNLRNGSVIRCLPTGESGYGIRGFTIDRLYADEAAFIKEAVWAAVTPMLATTGGDIILLSTPFGIENYFYRMFHSDQFTSIHVDPEEVINNRPEPQRSNLIEFRAAEKERMTRMQYQQEHLGLFVGGQQRFIPDELIDAICIINPEDKYIPLGDKFQGIDIARFGGDECPMISFDRINRKELIQFDFENPPPQRLTDTARLIIHKDKLIKHKKIYMDDGGLGVGVYDILYEDRQTTRKVEGLNNASREIKKVINKGKTKITSKALLGEDMAMNFKMLAEQGKIKLWDHPEIRQSLRSMTIDMEEGKIKITGNYDHIFEALKRGAWSMKNKTLSILPFCK